MKKTKIEKGSLIIEIEDVWKHYEAKAYTYIRKLKKIKKQLLSVMK